MAERGTYRRIADELRQQIQSGELPAGAMLPSEASLSAQYDIARGTARSALALLTNDGLIEVVPGRGRRVTGESSSTVTPAAYERIASELRNRLATGEFRAGDPLPSEAALMSEYGVSRNTVRRAYRYLVEVGAVEIRHGAGAYPARS